MQIDIKSYKNIDVDDIGYITIKDTGDYENIHRVNPFYFIVCEVDWYTEKKSGNKYLIIACTDKTKSLIKKIIDEPGDYDEKHIKIKFNSDDNLPLNKILKLH